MKQINTLGVMMATAAVWGAWEFYTLANDTDGDTLSATSCVLCEQQPGIALGLGAAISHFLRGPKARAAFMAGWAMGKEHWPLIDGQKLRENE